MEKELSRAETRRRWTALIKRVYEVDPLVCPKCGGEMRVIALALLLPIPSAFNHKAIVYSAGCSEETLIGRTSPPCRTAPLVYVSATTCTSDFASLHVPITLLGSWQLRNN
jgi:hypothetical protein